MEEEKRARALIVDMALRQIDQVPDAERCTYIRPQGGRCVRRRMGKDAMCHAHETWWRTIPAVYGLPFPEDAVSLQLFLGMTMHYIMTGKFNGKQLAVIQELSRLVSKNVQAVEWERSRE